MIEESLTLADFIERRRTELSRAEEKLREELAAILEERAQLDKAALAAGLHKKPVADYQEQDVAIKRRPRKASAITIKEAVLQVLSEAGHGMTAADLLPRINRLLGIEYPRSSLSPQLSRLKTEGALVLEGAIWLRPDQAKQKPVDENTLDGSSTGLKHEPEAQGREAGPGGGT
jgi:hypothetical protein